MRDIRIPSILISKVDGKAFEEEILAGKEPVLVELEWRMPAQWPVAVNFWADPGDVQGECYILRSSLSNLVPLMSLSRLFVSLP